MLGLRVGYVVGVFEALRYYQHDGDDGQEGEEGEGGEERGEKIWREAERALRMDRIFGENFFDRDGVWKFDLGGGQGRGEHQERRDHGGAGVSANEKKQGDEKEERELITFFDVADSHPLIKEWMQKAKDELKRCGVEDRGPIEAKSQ